MSTLSSIKTKISVNDSAILKGFHEFIRDDDEDESKRTDWRIRMSRGYYDKLFKEYAIIDLSRYETGEIGMRWRTENEVIEGKGQYICGARKCNQKINLRTFEVPFQYKERDELKMELVKVRLCPDCAEKLTCSQSIQNKTLYVSSHSNSSSNSTKRSHSKEDHQDKLDCIDKMEISKKQKFTRNTHSKKNEKKVI